MTRTLAAVCLCVMCSAGAYAHGVAAGDKGYIQEISGTHLLPFVYLGAKHMVTGYDHLLFLAGVIFFLYKLKAIALYVTLFAVGHSLTMLYGVYAGVNVNAYWIDAIIGLSVVYKALDNLGAYQRWFGVQPDTKIATLAFGLCHGFGLAAKVQEYDISRDGLLPNLLAFNSGVELAMRKGGHVNYEWTVAGGAVNYDTHGDPVNAPKNFYHGYGKGLNKTQDSGTLQAAFDGTHGWMWRNRGGSEVTVTLKTSGDYQPIDRVL